MCGLAGSYDSDWNVEEALDSIAHRGPDARGIRQHGAVVHGHVRLAIQDPDPRSDQPFGYEGVILSYVGELWNAPEVRAELEGYDYRFRTTGDTEVMAAALDAWGPDALPRLEGMFAVAWSDMQRGTFLARDRFGKIPLYWLPDGLLGCTWASERRAFGRLAAEAQPVPPGAVCRVGEQGWSRWYRDPPPTRETGRERAEWVLDRLRAAVAERLVSDVPVCALVSGGLDSTLTALLAREFKPDLVAYTAAYDPEGPDPVAARRACDELGIELREVEVPEPSEETIREAVEAIEVPYKVQVEIAMLALPLAKQIAADGFKVVVCGDGADELFGGYGNLARHRGTYESWRDARVERVRKMGRADLVRQNKAFMRHGVEPRIPFLGRELVEGVLAMGPDDCPPAKKLLKQAAESVVPGWIIKRDKDTFQGGSGVSARCEELTNGSATRYYNGIAVETFGGLPKG
jgi:asparagine synthase (glutamine-hydrolysing)